MARAGNAELLRLADQQRENSAGHRSERDPEGGGGQERDVLGLCQVHHLSS